MKKLLLTFTALALMFTMSACEKANEKVENTPVPTPTSAATKAPSKTLEELTANTVDVVIELEDGRSMNAEVYPDLAPITVENFLKLVDEDFYAGLIFHRVIPGFMIQGGGMDKDMNEKETASIKGEFESNGVENPLKHEKGVLSMARTQVPDSASSQFFIMHEASPHLDGEYAAFGKITDEESLKVVDEIAAVETTSVEVYDDVPAEPVIIKTIRRANAQ